MFAFRHVVVEDARLVMMGFKRSRRDKGRSSKRPLQIYFPISCPFGQFIRWHVIGFHCSLDSMCVSHLVLDSIVSLIIEGFMNGWA